MNVLMLCGEIPYPPHGGSRMRVYQFIRALAERHRLTLLVYQYDYEDSVNIAALAAFCRVIAVRWQEPQALKRMREAGAFGAALAYAQALLLDSDPFVAQYFRLPEFQTRLGSLLAQERFDLIHVEDTALMTVLPAKLSMPVVLSIQNVEYWREARAGGAGVRQRFEEWKLRQHEARAFVRAAVCCPTSKVEAEQVQRLVPSAQVRVVGNGVDTTEFAPPSDNKRDYPTLVFTGTLSYEPNAEGIVWFVRTIWPLILSAVPEARLRIVGREPPAAVRALASQQIDVCADVPDVRPYLHSACLSIAPLQHGGGTRLKILEALACALPVVSTTLGAEGLDAVPERDLLIADDPAAFAEQTIRLLHDRALRDSLGQAGRTLVERQYDWHTITDILQAAYQLALRR